MPHITIGTPTFDGSVTLQYLRSVLPTTSLLANNGIGWTLTTTAHASIDVARNQIVSEFMKSDSTHLLWIDADIGWKPADVLSLLNCDKEFIGAAARMKRTEREWAVGLQAGGFLEDGLIQAESIGTSFVLLTRGAIRKMFGTYPELQMTGQNSFALYQHDLFDGQMQSEDITFCRRWRAAGGVIFIDPSIVLTHVGRAEFSGALREDLKFNLPD